MARDWSGRARALTYFEDLWKLAKRVNDADKEHYEEAVNALRRSQDHTAIQNKLTSAVRCIRSIAEMAASTHEVDRALCQEWLDSNAQGKTGGQDA